MRDDFADRVALAEERNRSQVLLQSLMPDYVSEELTNPSTTGIAIVHYEPSVSVLFCDIVGFSEIVDSVRR